MGLPILREYEITRGQTWRASWRFLADDEAIDFTGYTFYCQIRDGLPISATLLSTAAVTVEDNRVEIEFDHEQTAIWGRRVWGDLWAVDTLGQRWPYVTFKILVNHAHTEIT